MALDTRIIVDVFSTLVESMRETGTVDSIVVADGVSTIVSANELSDADIIKINDIDYEVSSVTANGFKITSIVVVEDDEWTACAPYYDHGSPIEVSNRLIGIGEEAPPHSYKKYPLIYLMQDIDERRKNDGYYSTLPKLRVFILAYTDRNYRSTERYVNVFTPVLYPLYYSLLDEMVDSEYFDVESEIDHTKVDRLFWGTKYALDMGNKKSIFKDPLDAIEININDLLVLNPIINENC